MAGEIPPQNTIGQPRALLIPLDRERAELARQEAAFHALPPMLQVSIRRLTDRVPGLVRAARGFPSSEALLPDQSISIETPGKKE
ncbi:MAG: hypothetical protein KGL95_15085 [Patescibacteria group bacterium]|nr:hypothetical protein [Patescibacteria group bacterium]